MTNYEVLQKLLKFDEETKKKKPDTYIPKNVAQTTASTIEYLKSTAVANMTAETYVVLPFVMIHFVLCLFSSLFLLILLFFSRAERYLDLFESFDLTQQEVVHLLNFLPTSEVEVYLVFFFFFFFFSFLFLFSSLSFPPFFFFPLSLILLPFLSNPPTSFWEKIVKLAFRTSKEMHFFMALPKSKTKDKKKKKKGLRRIHQWMENEGFKILSFLLYSSLSPPPLTTHRVFFGTSEQPFAKGTKQK